MASTQEVRQYLAHWFQLGKKVTVPDRESIFTQKVLQGNTYTIEFEDCWQQTINQPNAYLEGTDQTIAELLTDRWDVVDCARCTMPIPLPAVGLPQNQSCTCHDLPTWPNTQVPMPRAVGAVENRTNDLRQRLAKLPLSPPQPSSPDKTEQG
jgi:hypothetical protein